MGRVSAAPRTRAARSERWPGSRRRPKAEPDTKKKGRAQRPAKSSQDPHSVEPFGPSTGGRFWANLQRDCQHFGPCLFETRAAWIQCCGCTARSTSCQPTYAYWTKSVPLALNLALRPLSRGSIEWHFVPYECAVPTTIRPAAMTGEHPHTTDFGFQDVPWSEKARRVPRRLRFGGGPLRPDERPDVGRRASALEALHPRADGTAARRARTGRRRRHRRSGRGTGTPGRRARAGGAGAISTQRCCSTGAIGCTDRGLVSQRALCAGRRRAPAVRGRQLRLHHHRLRPAQRHRQARRAGVDAPRTASPAASCWCWNSRSPAVGALGRLYDLYSFNVLPRLGRLVAGDADSYRYLAESIQRHPDQAAAAGDDGRAPGFGSCRYHNLRAASWRCTAAIATDMGHGQSTR